MRRWWLVLAVFAVGGLQTSWLGAWRPLGVIPDLALAWLIWSSWRLSAIEALGQAAGLGLLLDLASGTDFGLRIAFFMAFTLALLVIRQLGADVETWSFGLALMVAATILHNLVIMATVVTAHVSIPLAYVGRITVLQCLLNAAILALLRPLASRLWPETAQVVEMRGHFV